MARSSWRSFWSTRGGWLTAASLAAVVMVNLAGVWEIASARRGAREVSERVFRLETTARANAIESRLAAARADLAFLSGAPAVIGLGAIGPGAGHDVRRRASDEAGEALLIFLRGHPEIEGAVILSRGVPAVEAGRPRGVAGYWLPSSAPHEAPSASRPGALVATLESPAGPGAPGSPVRIEAALDAEILLERDPVDAAHGLASCSLHDGEDALVSDGARTDPQEPGAERIGAEAPVSAEGWGRPSPWKLRCLQNSEPALALVEPLAARYGVNILLNLAVMGLTVLLGTFAIQEARRRQLVEDREREQERVRELERQLFHAERLSTVGRLAAGMAHEINNPLEGMSNYLSLTRGALERGDPENALRQLAGVREGLDRAAGIVRRVLEQADRTGGPSQDTDLNEVLSRSVEFVRSRPEFAGVRFELDLDRRSPSVRGNPVTLGQVFLNLLLNACEAQSGSGEVLVRSRGEGEHALAEVADRGPGIPEQDRERVFEAFHSTKGSTGLGLFICRSIARQHGAELTVTGREGRGALFRVRLRASKVVKDSSESKEAGHG